MTWPPLRATVPSASTNVTPMTRSRREPCTSAAGPASAVAIRPPTVAPSVTRAASNATCWPCGASSSCRSRSRVPARTATVMSAGLWVITPARPVVSRTASTGASRPAHPAAVPAPAMPTVPAVSSTASRRDRRSVGRSGAAVALPWLIGLLPRTLPATPAGSQALDDARLLQRVGPVLAGPLAAQPRRGQDLAGVAQPARVPRAADAAHDLQVVDAEHLRHRARLVRPDAVLARERPAQLHAQLRDLAGELLGALGLARGRVVEHERVEVAVARVEDVGHPQPGRLAHGGDAVEHLGEPGARHDAVLHEVVGRD